jgi:putative salt-induced outer membrane protein YdiY
MMRIASKFNDNLTLLVCVGMVGLLSIVWADTLAAQEQKSSLEVEKTPSSVAGHKQPHDSFVPPLDEFDWIQLTSGEWLKGKLKALYDRSLEFDSDELDLLTLDWEDVKQIRGYRTFSVRFVGPVTVNGRLRIDEENVFMTIGDETRKFERSQVLAIAPGEPKELNYWTAKVSLGLTLLSGNTDQTQYSAIGDVKRQTSASRLVTNYLGNYSETDDVRTVNNHRLTGYFDVFRTKNYFFRPVYGEYFNDEFKNIKYRVTLGAGVGWHIIDTAKTEWDVSAGPAYQWTRFDSVEEQEKQNESTPALLASTQFETELTKRLDFNFLYSLQFVNETSGTYNHHFVATLETELTDRLDFDISYVWDRTQDPEPNDDGTVPEPDDYYLIFALGFDF